MGGRGFLRGLALGLAFPALLCHTVAAEDLGPLYRTVVYVTGQREETRWPAFAQAFRDVLVKVSGDPRLADDARVEEMARAARGYVTDYRYRDRMEGIPLHDEQGSRDRPYELTVDFDPARIEAALAELESRPWTGERPRVVVFLAVEQEGASYVLASEGPQGRGQREAWTATAQKYGLPILLPTADLLQEAGLTAATLSTLPSAGLESLARRRGGDVALLGRTVWRDEELGWAAQWQLAWKGRAHAWRIRGVNFDAAFRNAAGGALAILSGRGMPE